MKIEELKIEGFRNFNNFEIKGLQPKGLVVLAGQNGTGKYIITVVDKDNLITETDETNNSIVYGPIP